MHFTAQVGTAFFEVMFLTSVWCAAAALISVYLYMHATRVRHLAPA
jgi:hypothetical protein